MNLHLAELKESDFVVVKEIYDYYIATSTATFHTEPVTIEELQSVILTEHPRYKSYLIYSEGEVCGYCYLSQYKKRQAYDRTAEISIYLRNDFTGKGIGAHVLQQMEKLAAEQSIHVLIAIISEENQSSVKLFERLGYEKCAHFRQVGEKFGRLLDIVAYQKMI